MKNRRILGLALLMVMAAGSSTNAIAGGSIQGAGAMSCGKWVEYRKAGDHHLSLAWVMGFMSSYNHYVDESANENGIFREIDHSSIALWMDKYCENNPLKSVYSGAFMLIDAMKAK